MITGQHAKSKDKLVTINTQRDLVRLNLNSHAGSKDRYLAKKAIHAGSFEENYPKPDMLYDERGTFKVFYLVTYRLKNRAEAYQT